MKNKIKELRIKIDGLAQLVKELYKQPNLIIDSDSLPKDKIDEFVKLWQEGNLQQMMYNYPIVNYKEVQVNNHELQKSYDSLILAKAWLGKVLQELGEETPYNNDGNRKTVEDIEETADTKELNVKNLEYSFKNTNWTIMNHIEQVDWLREEIKKCCIEAAEFNLRFEIQITQQDFSRTLWENVYTHLSEARFWLGFELSRCRDESNK